MNDNKYQRLIDQIHAPAELSDRVISTAEQSVSHAPAPRTHRWGYAAACAVCVLALAAGSFSLYSAPPGTDPGNPTPDLSTGGLILSASAADLSVGTSNGGLGMVVSQQPGEDSCLFQVSGEGIDTLSLSLEGGELFHSGSSEAVSQIVDDYTPDAHYGIRLTTDSAVLTIQANNTAATYLLTEETLRQSQTEDGQPLLVPRLAGDPTEGVLGVYAVDSSQSRWLRWPVEQVHTIRLSAPYGPALNGHFHTGIDIPAQSGTPISAAADGRVLEVGFSNEDGHYVVLDHGDGLVTRYHHCLRLQVEEGAAVRAGDTIAQVGSTGMATGPHLHFEVRQDGVAQDPTAYFDHQTRDVLRMA